MHVLAMVSMLVVGLSMTVRLLRHCGIVYAIIDAGQGGSSTIPAQRATQVEEVARGLPTTPGRLQRVGRIGLVPFHITGRAVDRRHVLTGQAQPGLHLRPVMAGV